jgi:hypothetical protein
MPDVTTTLHMPTPCPGCGAPVDALSSVAGKRPNPDDVSVCVYCAAILVVTPEFTVRAATGEDEAKWNAEEKLQLSTMKEIVQRLRQRRPGEGLPC